MATAIVTKSNRRVGYEQRVADFITTFGPTFRLVSVTHTKKDGTNCRCCGYRDIHTVYRVQSTEKGDYFEVGSECQLLVLGIEQAELNAEFIRQLPKQTLVKLAVKLGIKESVAQRTPWAQLKVDTLKMRRHLANKEAWRSRRAVSVAP